MKNKIPCEMIQDLFPSYIDNLTCEVTNKEISEHLSECNSCSKVLSEMKNPDVEPQLNDNKEIDFLKKTRRRTKRAVLTGIVFAVVAALLISSVFFAKTYLSEIRRGEEYIECDIQVKDNVLNVSAYVTNDIYALRKVDFEYDGETVDISFKVVQKSMFFKNGFKEEYIADGNIKEVRLNDKIVWSQGDNISEITADVYNTRHPFIGAMTANSETAAALNISHLGRFINELQTSYEPYDWKLIFLNSFSSARQTEMERLMKAYAYVLLASVDNLGTASFEYVIDGEEKLLTVSQEEASQYAGENIKAIGQSINKLQLLMEKTGLDELSYQVDYNSTAWKNYHNNVTFQVTNMTHGIGEIALMCYVDGKLYSTQRAKTEDSSGSVNNYPVVNFNLIPADLGTDKWEGEKEITFKFAVYDYKGNEYILYEDAFFNVNAELGKTYFYNIEGDSRFGYMVTQ